MALDYAESIAQLLANLVALLLCLFHYISGKRKGWAYAILFFLSALLSCYYWTAYQVIMGDSPQVSDLMAYFGWNGSYILLMILLFSFKSPEERRYFHPAMLLPVPLNVWQFTLYLPYGTLSNNIYQVAIGTALSVFSIQGICWYVTHKKEGARKPYIPLAVLLFITFEFGMWTFSTMYPPLGDLYYPCSFLCSATYLLLVWALRRTYAGEDDEITFDQKYQTLLKIACMAIVLGFSLGGILLGTWMRDQMMTHMGPDAVTDLYDIIPVVLFVISLIIVIFMVATIFVVYFAHRAAENNKLREARQIAERSSAAKSEFLANMSHEIRTPINAVMGMNEIILRESLQARDRQAGNAEADREVFSDICGYAGIIDSAGKNLLSIINDILDISKIEAGKLEIRESPYSLREFLSDICRLIGFRAQSRGLDFRADVDPRLPDSLNGDESRVRQVILNILNNAVKYTNKGTVTLTVSGTPISGYMPGQRINLTFAVADTGVGIRQKDLARLFEKFERVGPAGTEQVEGTGLGLTISKNLLDMMGGTIQVESEFGSGSLFTVTIPQKIVSTGQIGEFDVQEDSDTEESPRELFRAPGAKILVVDDTRMNLTVVEGLLKKTEMHIDSVLSGEEALQLTVGTHYDVILMDQRMYGMDGTETMRRIRAQVSGTNITTPIICLTADAIAGVREKYIAEGFTDYLSKPIDTMALKKLLLRYLPPAKVHLIPKDEAREAAENQSSAAPGYPEPLTAEGTGEFAPLAAEGINPVRGLHYCQHDEALYRSLLSEFAASAKEREQGLETSFAAKDWKSYALLVHTIKSTSGTIGATALSETAAVLEAAANSGDEDRITKEHPLLLTLFRRTSGAVSAFCTDADVFPPENGGIIEFDPEDDGIIEFDAKE